MRKLFLIILLLIPLVNAAHLSGTAYTDSLQIAKDTLLSIDTIPAQRLVLTDGTYNLTVPKGTYHLKAIYTQGRHQYEDELNITVIDSGEYSYDFILFPTETNNTEDVPSLENITFADVQPASASNTQTIVMILLLVFLIVLALVFSRKKWWKQPEPALIGDLEKIITLMRKEGGRMTQRELRKELPYSEAKISMMIAELESQGKVKKIKQGRGNILVLK